jgi:hypothetical protein
MRFFSPLDLYLAGFYQASEVPPFLLIESPDHSTDGPPKAGITVHGRATTVTIEDVIAAEGPRLPSADQAQKQFKFAFILLTTPGHTVETEDLTAIERVSTKFAERFAVWTGGRAIIHVEQATLPTEHVGAPDMTQVPEAMRDHPTTLGTALSDGLAWLQSQQRQDGSWWDKPATAVRDTTAVIEALLPLTADFVGREQAVAWKHGLPSSTNARAWRDQHPVAASAAGHPSRRFQKLNRYPVPYVVKRATRRRWLGPCRRLCQRPVRYGIGTHDISHTRNSDTWSTCLPVAPNSDPMRLTI